MPSSSWPLPSTNSANARSPAKNTFGLIPIGAGIPSMIRFRQVSLVALVFATVVSLALSAQPLPIVRMETSDPDQLAQNLRRKAPIPGRDCQALNLWECHADDATRIGDISMRWVQLDGDPELEAILVLEAKAENTYAAYIFDKQGSWNLVGSFWDRQWTSDGQHLIRVLKLTEDSPVLTLVTRDLGGSGSVIFTTEAFHLREGQLWPVLTITGKEEHMFPSPSVSRQLLLSAPARLIISTVREGPAGKVVRNECEVLRWDPKRYVFAAVPKEEKVYCDGRTGKPIESKSHTMGFPIYP